MTFESGVSVSSIGVIMKFIPTLSNIEELSHMNSKEAGEIYRKAYWKNRLFKAWRNRSFFLSYDYGELDYLFGDLGRWAGIILGSYSMAIYIFNKMDFSGTPR